MLPPGYQKQYNVLLIVKSQRSWVSTGRVNGSQVSAIDTQSLNRIVLMYIQ